MFTAEFLKSLFDDVENKECEFEIKTDIPKPTTMGTDFTSFRSLTELGEDMCRKSATTIVEVVDINDNAMVLRKSFKKVLLVLDGQKGTRTITKVTLHNIPLNRIVDVVFIEQESEKFSKKL